MANTTERKEKLSIYLVKDGHYSPDECVKLELVGRKYVFNIPGLEALLYVKREAPAHPPLWTRIFTEHPDAPTVEFGKSSNVGAALYANLDGKKFLISFGSGFHLINGELTERDFGLRVTLNAVDPEKLRSLDKASYDDNPLNSRTQSSLEVDIFDLQANTESDLVYAVTGACKVPLLGTHITGRDALTLMVETDLNGIPGILSKAIELFNSPLPSAYAWIDNIAKVRDPDTIRILDLLLDDEISKAGGTNVWLGEPEIVNWESNSGYSFDMYQSTPRHQILCISDLREYLDSKSVKFSLDAMKNITVHINDANYRSTQSWPAYRCIHAEIADGNDRFIIRNGSWFKIEADFIAEIDRRLSNAKISQTFLPPYSYANEGEYNSQVAKSTTNIHLMDKKNVKTGGPYDKIEFCDLIVGSSNFVHVKYYRSSATLSHLFSQGAVAAEIFLKDEDFRRRLNAKLPSHIALTDTARRPDPSSYTITYAIATSKALPIELPFFSKVTLKNSISHLEALGFNVELTNIPLDPTLSKIKKYRPKAVRKKK
ncbi:TIGR04141 family sporadically distributed protein [Stenotrophomonas sp. P2112]|uniref:TIGR04141 family sporadically distributed protein n=1 Tax=Stenotrophomonas sp. P2112 TaxID=3308998 RepID=UPI0035A83456